MSQQLRECIALCCAVCLSQPVSSHLRLWPRTMMLRRAKRAAIFASPVVAVGMWAGVVLKERSEAPPDVRFSIGSAGRTALLAMSVGTESRLSRRDREEDSAYSLRTKLHVDSSVLRCGGGAVVQFECCIHAAQPLLVLCTINTTAVCTLLRLNM